MSRARSGPRARLRLPGVPAAPRPPPSRGPRRPRRRLPTARGGPPGPPALEGAPLPVPLPALGWRRRVSPGGAVPCGAPRGGIPVGPGPAAGAESDIRTDAVFPGSRGAPRPAVAFVDNRIQKNMLVDLNKEMMNEVGIREVGDIVAILRHARVVCRQMCKAATELLCPSSPDVQAELRRNANSTASRTIAASLSRDSPPAAPLPQRPHASTISVPVSNAPAAAKAGDCPRAWPGLRGEAQGFPCSSLGSRAGSHGYGSGTSPRDVCPAPVPTRHGTGRSQHQRQPRATRAAGNSTVPGAPGSREQRGRPDGSVVAGSGVEQNLPGRANTSSHAEVQPWGGSWAWVLGDTGCSGPLRPPGALGPWMLGVPGATITWVLGVPGAPCHECPESRGAQGPRVLWCGQSASQTKGGSEQPMMGG
ncbi:uncharacterized protein LOC141974080 [Athene noctua]|uniref:uncharacterized protein LOC141974080 n=1 Tax=Athene noctua TaxID=126797 RepID=UPI003EBA63FB